MILVDSSVWIDYFRGNSTPELGGKEIAIEAARNFRALRLLGVTVRKTVDALMATRCMASGFALLYGDRGLDPLVRHYGLRSAMA